MDGDGEVRHFILTVEVGCEVSLHEVRDGMVFFSPVRIEGEHLLVEIPNPTSNGGKSWLVLDAEFEKGRVVGRATRTLLEVPKKTEKFEIVGV